MPAEEPGKARRVKGYVQDHLGDVGRRPKTSPYEFIPQRFPGCPRGLDSLNMIVYNIYKDI